MAAGSLAGSGALQREGWQKQLFCFPEEILHVFPSGNRLGFSSAQQAAVQTPESWGCDGHDQHKPSIMYVYPSLWQSQARSTLRNAVQDRTNPESVV